MARYISPAIQNLLNNGESIEPIMVIGIVYGSGNVEHFYADRDLGDPLNPYVKGKILDLGQLENIKRIDGSGSATEITFKLSDSDGYIKSIIDTIDVIYKKVRIYQYFEGIAFADMIPIFEGVLATPIVWEEGARTISMSAITRQSSHETGFSLDDSAIDIYHQDLLDKPWPMIFGSPIYTPTLPLQEVPIGYLVHGCVLPDSSIPYQIQKIQYHIDVIREEPSRIHIEDFEGDQFTALVKWSQALIDWETKQTDRIDRLEEQIIDLESKQQQQYSQWRPNNDIIGGYRFPQGVKVICKINERTFKIKYLGGNTVPTNPDHPCPASLELFEIPFVFDIDAPLTRDQQKEADAYDLEQINLYNAEIEKYGSGTLVTRNHQRYFNIGEADITKAGADYFPAGTQVELFDDLPGGYMHVASITPGTVLGVYAYRTQNSYRRLAQVPPKYYSIRTSVSGNLVASYVVLNRPLSTISYFNNLKTTSYERQLLALQEQQGQLGVSRLTNKIEWDDEIFVNFQSAIGPNAVDVIRWLIEGYTSYAIDETSFQHVHAQLANNPVNFCLEDRQNVDDLIQEIAYQCRSAVWIKNSVYFIKFLAASPVPTDTLTDDHIDFGSLRVEATSSDDIVTKYIATWKASGIVAENKLIVKNNVERFGILEESHAFFCFNNYNQVIKAATFWLIRKSNIWKKVFCNVHLTKLNIETLDDIILKLNDPFVTIDPDGIWTQVESCQYDSSSNLIAIELWLSIRFGEMTFYPYTYPAELPSRTFYAPDITMNTGRPPVIASERFNPLMPYYNEIQKTIIINRTTSDIGKKVEPNGYVIGDYVSTKGDALISDSDMDVTQPEFDVVDYTDPELIPGSDTYTFLPIPSIPTTITTSTGNSNVYPGKILNRGTDGIHWFINTYPNGLETTPTLIEANELHGDVSLVGLENEWVTIFEIQDNANTKHYYFMTQHTAAMPMLLSNRNIGAIYPFGPSALGYDNLHTHQIQMDNTYEVPSGTWAIGVRVWNGTTAQYEVQVPVWLPRP